MTHLSLLRTAAVASAALLGLALAAPAHAQKAALTRDVDRASAQPVNGTCAAFGSSTQPGVVKCVLFAVPAGKRLVVELVGYNAATASGTFMQQVAFGLDDGSSYIFAGLPNVAPVTPALAYDNGSTRSYAGSQVVKLYIDENQRLAGGVFHAGNANYQQIFSFSGYLVDK